MNASVLLKDGGNQFIMSILAYEESDAAYRADRNVLLTSIEIRYDGKSSLITAPVISTHELSALANWFEQTATNRRTEPVILLEPCLFFDCLRRAGDFFEVMIRMEAEASPNWTKYYAEPFAMTFQLTYAQMLETARSLRRLHLDFPTQ